MTFKTIILVSTCWLINCTTLFSQTITWSDPIVVNDDRSLGTARPKIALNGSGNPVIMWGKRPNREVYVSTFNGDTFSAPVNVVPNGVTTFVQNWAGPSLDSRGDTVFVAFKSQPEQDGFVYVVRSINGGLSFEDTIRVSVDNLCRFPEVSVGPGGNPAVTYMAFEDGFVVPHYVVSISNDGGNTFTSPVDASSEAPGEVCDCCPGFVLYDDYGIFSLFRNNDDDLRDIWAAVSTDNGASYQLAKDIDPTNWQIGGCPSTGPEAIRVNDSLVSVWMSGADGESRIYMATSSVNNLGPGGFISLSTPADGLPNYPKITGDEEFVIVIWQENKAGTVRIKAAYGNPEENLLSDPKFEVISPSESQIQQGPDVVYSDGVVHVVWQDLSNNKVLYKRGIVKDFAGVPLSKSNELMSVFPNPTSGVLSIDVANFQIEYAELLSSAGVVVSRFNLRNELNEAKLDISNVAQGIYILQVYTTEKRFVQRVIKN